MLRLGEEHLAAVVLLQQLAGDLHFAAIALAEKQARLAVVVPAEHHRAAAFLEQQQRRHGDLRNLLQAPLHQAALQTRTGGGAGQQIGGQALFRQRQAAGEHGPVGGFVVQDAQRQQ
ncbi:hypothetical protein D9M72_337140 [compost metagenome]